MGGVSADPVVSAVLNAVGKRYLVESGTSEDGTIWYERYSDGKIIQGGYVTQSATNIVFPIEFQTDEISIVFGSIDGSGVPRSEGVPTRTGFKYSSANHPNSPAFWRVEGY